MPLRQADLGNACGLTPETSSRGLDRRVDIMQAGALRLSAGYDALYLHLRQTDDIFRALFEN